jgi:carbon-monoxide dehydrogenase large subunit
VADLELAEGAVRAQGDPNACRTLRELAESAWLGWDLPEGMAPGLEERGVYDPPRLTYAYAVHAAAVAVDPETGAVEVEGYWLANDSGVVVNPMSSRASCGARLSKASAWPSPSTWPTARPASP